MVDEELCPTHHLIILPLAKIIRGIRIRLLVVRGAAKSGVRGGLIPSSCTSEGT